MSKHTEATHATSQTACAIGSIQNNYESTLIHGHYSAVCRSAAGVQLWRDDFDNLVTTAGKNLILDSALSGNVYTASFFLGLISAVSYTAVSEADTMIGHAGWLEAGLANAPAYSEATRRAAAWAAATAGRKSLSAGLIFTFTSAGTVKGSFLSTVATKDGTTGTLYSAGLFASGDQTVAATNTLTVSYTASLNPSVMSI